MQYFIGVNDSEFLIHESGDRFQFDTFGAALVFASEVVANPMKFGFDDGPEKLDIETEDEDGETVAIRTIYRSDF